jgi:hypothetical protein
VSIAPEQAELVLARRVRVELERARWELVPRQQVVLLTVLVLLSLIELERASLERARKEQFDLEPELRKPELASLARG